MPEVFVGLGSNVEPAAPLRVAVDALTRRFGVPALSSANPEHFDPTGTLNLRRAVVGDANG